MFVLTKIKINVWDKNLNLAYILLGIKVTLEKIGVKSILLLPL